MLGPNPPARSGDARTTARAAAGCGPGGHSRSFQAALVLTGAAISPPLSRLRGPGPAPAAAAPPPQLPAPPRRRALRLPGLREALGQWQPREGRLPRRPRGGRASRGAASWSLGWRGQWGGRRCMAAEAGAGPCQSPASLSLPAARSEEKAEL